MTVRCRCGQVRGAARTERAYTRATCYCRDCRAYARFLGGSDVLDAHGGTDLVPIAPAGLRLIAGLEALACVSLGPRGLLRWYAACCRAPIANTPRQAQTPYVGVFASAFDVPAEALDAALGPRGALVIHAGSARGDVAPTRWRFALGGLRIVAGMTAARLRGEPPAAFFDTSGRPIRHVRELTLEERTKLSDAPAPH
ncbi:MAG TPA: DUF6151 family protein [Dokdonella sp.]|uniref:DUF6151 family protein n=1 Tax=Dokdonella sp. TaxID=2291710 RepID=UPI002D0C9A78|nr:DUF6151 family protein [Dokdonella sp.]HUD41032.1 DUF6151 family protein [Dokdonella sp.]